jgi:16S rRNA C1402 N4-methylase RsmH
MVSSAYSACPKLAHLVDAVADKTAGMVVITYSSHHDLMVKQICTRIVKNAVVNCMVAAGRTEAMTLVG